MISLNYPDSCLFFGVFSGVKPRLKRQRELSGAYFYGINKEHEDLVSTLTLGEVMMGLSEIPGEENKKLSFLNMGDLWKQMEVTSPQFEDCKLALELKEIDYNLEPADALHLAMAINKKANFFITLGERNLASNPKIEEFCKTRGLKIRVL